MQTATQQVLEKAEPIAKDITQGIIAPGAAEIRKNAVPIAQEVRALTLCILVEALSISNFDEFQGFVSGKIRPPESVHSVLLLYGLPKFW